MATSAGTLGSDGSFVLATAEVMSSLQRLPVTAGYIIGGGRLRGMIVFVPSAGGGRGTRRRRELLLIT